ncbi:MAG: FctA domain-containing protein [Coriobacteriales bacterium]|nr:FctA domain-containing protein [Coriobacteriales bacterium]
MNNVKPSKAQKRALQEFVRTFLTLLLAMSMVLQSASFQRAYAQENGEELPVETTAGDSTEDEAVSETEPAEEAVSEEAPTDEPVSADDGETASADNTAEADEPTEAADEQVDVEEKAPTKTVYTYVDKSIKVTATVEDPAAVPDNARLVVTAIAPGDERYDAYMDALNGSVSENPYNEGNTLLYDVTFMVEVDGETIEVEPSEGSVRVTFEFKQQQLTGDIEAERAADVEVTHLPEVDGTIEAEPLSTLASGEDSITVTTDTFSVFAFSYTVDFTYDGYTYRFPGQGSYALADVLAALGIDGAVDSATLELVEGLAIEGDLYLTQTDGVWFINSDVPFTSVYKLSIKCGNTTYVITVTDVQESTELSNFLTNAIITGATQNESGAYEVEQGKEYDIILTFAENSTYQFKNDADLTYTMPTGITVITDQSGPLNINIVYRGRTYQVGATYNLDTDGNLTVKFDETDPDYPRLVESTNVSFRFTYHAEFDGTATKIKFNDEIERDIVFDEPEPAQAFAEKTATFDETTGKFNYTITVTATGEVTDVNVRDVITGNALIFNNDVRVTGNSSDYIDNHAPNGFDYTFISMQEGEVITITYSANVDFSQDSDGDGKITVDQTKNTVTVEPDGGDPHSSEYSREIVFKSTHKDGGTEAGTTQTGDKIIEWTLDYNMLALAAAGGDTITDSISSASAEYMKYYGDGITIEVRDHDGNLVETRNVPYDELPAYSDSSWTYVIPEEDVTPYSYHIMYQTVVDMSKVNQGGVTVYLDNDANGSHGGVNVSPEHEIGVVKDVESFTTEEINWVTTLSIPEDGLIQAIVTDTLPMIRLDDGTTIYRDTYKVDSLSITGLLPGESYTVSPDLSTETTGPVVITFYKDSAKQQDGLQGTPGGHTITVRLTTKVNQEWLQEGYEVGGRVQNHTNTIDLNGKADTATVIFGKPGIEKTAERQPDGSFLYTLLLSGVSEVPVSIADTFDTTLLEIDTSQTGAWGDHMKIWGGTQYSQIAGKMGISYSETDNGVLLTANSVPMQPDGSYYPYYRICYYLRLKEGVDLEQLAIANGGEYHLINTARWGDHKDDFDYVTKYDYLTKELLNGDELGGTSRRAQYRITFNPAKATLNGGDPMTMTDTLSANLSIDYSSIQITTEPAGVSVPYSLKGGVGPDGKPDGTTVATYTIPDSTKVVITYDADVRGNGSQTIINKVVVNDKEETIENTHDYGSAGEGQGAIASFKIVKVDGFDANKKLEGVQFKVFAENPDLNFGKKSGYAKEITLTTDENGVIEFDGAEYDFYFNECYHVQEVEPAENYGTISFDYLVTLTNNMSLVDYGHYIYYYNDAMQIKNWPLEGLVVEKQVESSDPDDLERYFDFKISILKDDGSVDTDFNEKTDDYEFVNGEYTFQLKNKEQKMFWGFLKGTKYRVEEVLTDADGQQYTVAVDYDVFDDEGHVIEHKTETATSHEGQLTQEDEVIVFTNTKIEETGSLQIKKNVKVDGEPTTGPLADGTYTFQVKDSGGNVVAEPTITIDDGQSNTVTVDGLVPGTYTVSEDTSKNPSGVSLISDNDIEITVEAGETAEVKTAEFTNNYEIQKGSLTVLKKVESPLEADKDVEFSFSVSLLKDDGSVDTSYNATFGEMTFVNGVCEFTLHHDQRKTATGIPVNTKYKVQETSDPAFTVDPPEGKIESTVTSEAIVHVFTNTRVCGSLKIQKVVQENGSEPTTSSAKSALAGDYEFKVYTNAECTAPAKDADGNDLVITLTIADDGAPVTSEEIQNLPVGDYWVKETSPNNATQVSGDNPVKVTVEAGKTGEEAVIATITNNYETTKVPVTKAWKNADGSTTWPAGIESVTVKLLADKVDTQKTVTLSANKRSDEFTDLPKYQADGVTAIVYTVEEVDLPGVTPVITGDATEGFTITNTYSAKGGFTLAGVTKKLEGREIGGTVFTFDVIDHNGDVVATGHNDATGAVTFTYASGANIPVTLDDLDKDAGGNYLETTLTYTIKETSTDGGGITVDKNEYTFTVVAEDDGAGTILVNTEDVPEVNPGIKFTNTYHADGKGKIEATKHVTGTSLATYGAGVFRFELKGHNVKDGSEIVANDANGVVGFTEITFVQADLADVVPAPDGSRTKTFTYTITELEPAHEVKGVTLDTHVETVTITVVDKGDGSQLECTTNYDDDGAVFTNDYEASGSAKFFADKELSGRELKDGEFTFKLTGPKLPEAGVTATNIDGRAVFDTINYTLDDMTANPDGTHADTELIYTIEEVIPSEQDRLPGVTYATKKVQVKVTLHDKGDGTIVVTYAPVDSSDTALWQDAIDDVVAAGETFKNTYTAKGEIVIHGVKSIDVGTLTDLSGFTFTLSGNGVTETATTNADGSFSFAALKYELGKDGVVANSTKEFTYTISEAESDGYLKMEDITVKVTVTDNCSGELTVASDMPEAGYEIQNKHEATGYVEFFGTKSIDKRELTEEDVFTFEILENDEVIATATNDATGKINYPTITYELNATKGNADLGLHTYTVREAVVDSEGIKSDVTTYEVGVYVIDNGTSTLTVNATENHSILDFVNTYEASGKLVLSGAKAITDKPETMDLSGFKFTVKEGDAVVSTGTSAADGTITFDAIVYPNLSSAGEHTYVVSEDADSKPGVTNTTSTVTVKVEVKDDGEGGLIATATPDSPAAIDAVNFTNAYSAEGQAVLSAKKAANAKLGEKTFQFELLDEDGKVLQTSASVKQGETATFEAITYTLADLKGAASRAYTYQIREVLPAGATAENKYTVDNITYDTHVETVKVTVTDIGNGTLAVAYNGASTFATPEFANNTTDETSVSVKKEWTKGGKEIAWPAGAKVTVALMADGTKVAEHALTADVPSFTFMNLPKAKDDGTEIVYTVAEVSVSGLSDRYNTTVSGKAADGFVVKNSLQDLPKTGDIISPTTIGMLLGAGVLALAGGILLRVRKKKER